MIPKCPVPFPFLPTRRDSQWMDALRSPTSPPPGRKFKPLLRPAIKLDAVLASMRIFLQILFNLSQTFQRQQSPSYVIKHAHKHSTELRGLGENNNRAAKGPKLPCGFTKKRRPSRPLDYCLGKPEISGAPNPPLSFSLPVAHMHPYRTPAPLQDIFHRKILLTYSRSSIQVFSHFPLSFHSAVAPCAPPTIHCGPSSSLSSIAHPPPPGKVGWGWAREDDRRVRKCFFFLVLFFPL